ncbi:hypothetical protein LTR70_001091 [Exophiala xenobiotica]|uniref:Uncharacterized protein n=1 Tax=Lithohypha guttulata TaxID=1690604 RepID=A0ABR0KMS4_9EURO|nr:hypothetical protein LTR24_000720 [Lithohypha guttulata]KAK5328937.1 hypothetical protein LTR70_001091 [Exophiala xenobiotica]
MAATFTQQNNPGRMTSQNPRSSQPLSPLMGRPMNGNATGLPAEIRIKILRYLLRSGDLIRSQDEVGEAEFKTATKLSSQILQTCQILYEEGTVILYHENTLAVQMLYYPGNYKYVDFGLYYGFLGVGVLEQSNLDYAAKPTMLPLLQDLIERKRATNPSCTSEDNDNSFDNACAVLEYNDLDSWIAAYEILARFQKFHVVFRLDHVLDWHRDTVLSVCRRFRTAFLNNDVVMTIGAEWTRDASEILACLLPCRVLRCQSLRFDLPTEVGVNEIVRTVTSQEPMLDTYGMACLLRRDVFNKLDRIDSERFLTVHIDLWLELCDKASEYDIPAYQKLKESLLEKAQKWNQKCVHRTIEEVKEKGAKFEELINAEMSNELKAIE